jgi:hypothetical protein
MSEWGATALSREARLKLAEKLSFESIASKHCATVEGVASSTWTHKCTCPLHKEGRERTPSFYISDTEKTFFCYGCYIRGDIFDFIGIIKGSPGDVVARRYMESNGIVIDDKPDVDKPRLNVYTIYLQLSVKIRDYLLSVKDSDIYEIELAWADSIFRRIDERFTKIKSDDWEQGRNFSMQIMLEIEGRKS